MRIKWYGTASLLVESGDSRILIDPYLKAHNRKLPRIPMDEADTAQAVFITHPHLDHFRDIGAFLKEGRPVYVSDNGIRSAYSNGIDVSSFHPLNADGVYKVGEITVRTFRSRHCKFDAATVLRIAFSPRSYALVGKAVKLLRESRRFPIADDVYALEISDGDKRIMVLGSAGMDGEAVYPKGCDLLVFPYQGRTKMHKYIVPFLDVFLPKKVMADHFDNAFPPLTHKVNMNKFPCAVKEALPEAEAIVPAEGKWYEV